MIEFEGKEYIVDDPTTNAYNLLNYINEYLEENNVKNRKGELVQLKINLGSPIWLIVFGLGYMATVLQKIMYSVGQAFSIGSCSEQQVLSLAQIARVERKQGSYTVLPIRVTAGAGVCTITPADTVTYTYNDIEYVFTPVNEVSIPAGNTDTVYFTADKTGPVYITAGDITKLDTEPVNLASVSNLGAEPGTNVETINQLRTRIQENERVTPVAAAISAINGLTGVNKCNIIYNINNVESIERAGHMVKPRCAILFVQGSSRDIAETYYSHMYAETTKDTGSIEQSFTAENGQEFTVSYFPPDPINLYVKVILSKELKDNQLEEIRNVISSLSNSLPMGKAYTQAYMLNQISGFELYQYIVGLYLSFDGVDWGTRAFMGDNNIGIIQNSDQYIKVEVL
jgi:uncharacterized phage protein gp47/JayE|nr:MAG TPA: Baseplate wedge protein [Caudoviricetes sp.]